MYLAIVSMFDPTQLIEYGYFGLFLASFLAATVLPFYSEAILALMLLGKFDPWVCIIIASVGNWLGGMTSYYLGYLGNWVWIEKFIRIKKSSMSKWWPRLSKYGSYLALLCWAPVFGDALAVALGFIRSNVWLVGIFMFTGKLVRYIVLTYLILWGVGI